LALVTLVGLTSETEPAPPQPSPGRRFWALDVLRAVAVLLVLGRHFFNTQQGIPPALSAVLRTWKRFGWMGVDLFFVLSGFLVSGLVFAEYRKHGTIRPLRFLGRRGFKIYPAFYLFLLVTWLWKGDELTGGLFLHEALFIQNYTRPIWDHTWSLAIEEHFYLALALGLWALARRGGPNPFSPLPRICLLVAAGVLALRVRAYSINPTGWLLFPTHLRVDALLFGTLIAYGWTFHRAPLAAFADRHRRLIAAAAIVLLAPCLLLPGAGSFLVNTVGLTTNYLGFGAIVLLTVAASQRPQPRWERWLSPLARLGFYSYSIYLWHMAVRLVTTEQLPYRVGWTATLAIYFGASIVLGIITARLIELPFLRLRDRVLPSRA
jgi:peptidoglycan/LPS O-acetylase OafA/YrhL